MIAALSRRARSYPIPIGAVVGLAVGLVGFFALSFVGAALGAVAGGATAAILTDDGLRADVRNAVLADLVSSVLFFVGVVGWLVVSSPNAAGRTAESVLMALFYGAFGSFVAVPVALVSLCVAALAGTVASIATRQRGDSTVPGSDYRK